MSGSQRRTILGRSLLGACALVLPLLLTGCLPGLKDGPPTIVPPDDPPPVWSSLTIFYSNTQSPPSPAAATSWTTTVVVPVCTDAGLPVTITGAASNGSVVESGNRLYTWTRATTGGPPVQRVAGVFTAKCTDRAGQTAHPDLAVTVP